MSERQVPPTADKVVCIDFDGTILPWGPLFNDDALVSYEVATAIHRLHTRGYRIIILTSRMSPTWLKAEYEAFGFKSQRAFREANLRYIENKLGEAGVLYSDTRITAEKVPAEVYFDDKARHISLSWPLDLAIKAFIL